MFVALKICITLMGLTVRLALLNNFFDASGLPCVKIGFYTLYHTSCTHPFHLPSQGLNTLAGFPSALSVRFDFLTPGLSRGFMFGY